MDFQHYLLWSSISLIAFYLFYLLLLKRETFFVLNRVYLLTAICLSILIPFVDLSTLIELPKIELSISTLARIGSETLSIGGKKDMNWLWIIYYVGVAASAILSVFKLAKVKRHLKIPADGDAFSFWKTKVIDQKNADFKVIEAHENIHVKQLHTLDILLIEVIHVFLWFNPIIYSYRRSLKFIHEYLADEYAASFATSKKQYAMVLFLQNFKSGPALANTFYNVSLLESRIQMLQRKRSNTNRLWKYVLSVPLLFIVILFCSFDASSFNNNYTKVDKTASFPGGFEAFKNYIIKSSRNVSTKKGKVKLAFIVEKSGEITNERIINGLDDATNIEALRILKSSPKWEPALKNNEKVRSEYEININF